MDQVLGRNVGNALEVVEAVDYLTGEGTRDPRLHEVTMALAGEMLALGGLAPERGRRPGARRGGAGRRPRRGDVRPHGRGAGRAGRFPRARRRAIWRMRR